MAPKRPKTKSRPAKRRKGFLSVIVPWLRRFGIVLSVMVIMVWAGSWLWLSGAIHRGLEWANYKSLQFTGNAGLTVENIMVEGRVYSDPDVILALINARAGDPLFAFDPRTAKDQIEKMEWVERAHIERRLPDTIYIGLRERQPLALLHAGQTLALLDTNGEIITRSRLDRFANLIIITGKGGQSEAPEFLEILKGVPTLHDTTQKATYVGQRRWDLTLKNGVVIKLPENDVALALAKLTEAHTDDQILDRDLLSIDLRTPDRFIIRTRPGAVQDYKARTEEEKQGDPV